jgi:hypothetical protein
MKAVRRVLVVTLSDFPPVADFARFNHIFR